MTNFTQYPHDVALKPEAAKVPGDWRIPMAGEFDLDSKIGISRWIEERKKNAGWFQPPSVTTTGAKTLAITGSALIPCYPLDELAINTSIVIPSLASNSEITMKFQSLSLVGAIAEVGGEHDSELANVSFQFMNPLTNALEPAIKENGRRYRAFWLLALSPEPLTTTAFVNLLSTEANGARRLTITQPSSGNALDGFAIGNIHLYAMDSNWVQGGVYPILPSSVSILPICRVRRAQQYLERGYTWGSGGEEPLDAGLTVLDTSAKKLPFSDQVYRAALNIMAGRPNKDKSYKRTIQNLTSGAVAGNPGRPGESAGSPNGSVALANGQRYAFLNEGRNHDLAVQILTTSDDGSGNAIFTATLATNAPIGSRYNENNASHKLYAADGTEQSSLGTFRNLENSLTWTAGPNSTIAPSTMVYLVPSISYPAGSGLNVAYKDVERVWLSIGGGAIAELNVANILNGQNEDLTAYAAPSASQNYFLVSAPERAGIHYIYKRVQITTDSNGTAVIPSVERGVFAFIEGVTNSIVPSMGNRLDKPVWTGLNPNTTYNALIYYPPGNTDTWQLQLRYAEYQGLGEAEIAFINNAEVASEPLFFVHTMGGGTSVYQGEGELQYVPIAMHLPANGAGTKAYALNAPIHFANRPYPGPDTWRQSEAPPASGLALPRIGQKLAYEAVGGLHPRSLNCKVSTGGILLGFRSPQMSKPEYAIQCVMVVPLVKGGVHRLLIATNNGAGGRNIAFDSSQQTALDLFAI